jgi:hypothetical protein
MRSCCLLLLLLLQCRLPNSGGTWMVVEGSMGVVTQHINPLSAAPDAAVGVAAVGVAAAAAAVPASQLR